MLILKEQRKQTRDAAAPTKSRGSYPRSGHNSCGGCNACHQMTRIHSVTGSPTWDVSGGGSQRPCAANFFQRNLGNSYMQSIAGNRQTSGQATARAGVPKIQRKCACGGTCTRCAGKEEEIEKIQAKLTIGLANDVYEQEADRVADTVMRMSDPVVNDGASIDTARALQSIQRQIQSPVKVEEELVRTKAASGHIPDTTPNVEAQINTVRGEGQPLSNSVRAFMESRFSDDFSGVRIHTDTPAAEMARAINSRAFTLGRDIVFGAGQYAPAMESGRWLLAHELTHYLQQRSSKGQIQRNLEIAGPEDTSDPMSNLDPDERNEMVQQLVDELAEGFIVVDLPGAGGATGQIVPDSIDCSDTDTVASGINKPVGNCCLCILTGPGSRTWTIRIVLERGASVNPSTGTINIPASTSPAVSGHWTQADVRRMRPRVITFAHELCGHAALIEVQAHPRGSRVRGTRHDPTIRVEQAIWQEQGLPSTEERGLASSPVHRGESFTRIVVREFPFNDDNPLNLPTGEQDKLELAARLAFLPKSSPPPDFYNNRWVDITGHSDSETSSASANQVISDNRASNVRDLMINRLNVPPDIDLDNNFRPIRDLRFQSVDQSASRFTDVRGVSDSQCSSSGRDPNCRKVEIFIAGFPAGASQPALGTPTGPATLTPVSPPATAADSLRFGDACVQLLITEAWT